jgi:hypothetical protein
MFSKLETSEMDTSIWIAVIGAIATIGAAALAIVPALMKKSSSGPEPIEAVIRSSASENHPISDDDLSKFVATVVLNAKPGDKVDVAVHKNEE